MLKIKDLVDLKELEKYGYTKQREYALYKGDELLMIGSRQELAEKYQLKLKTITYYGSPAHLRRMAKSHIGNYKVVVKLD